MTTRYHPLWSTSCLQLVLGSACLVLAHNAGSMTDAPTEDGLWYYQIGGARPVSAPANPHVVSMTLGGSVDLRLGPSCGVFDPVLAVKHTLNEISRGVDNMMAAMTSAATGALASLPALILHRANPGLYDLFQNSLLKAEATLELATKSCEQMQTRIGPLQNECR